jgi:hypothetical protein
MDEPKFPARRGPATDGYRAPPVTPRPGLRKDARPPADPRRDSVTPADDGTPRRPAPSRPNRARIG